MLTKKQKDLLLLIRDRMATDGVPPSFDEMKDALGLRSKSGIHRLISGLEERGFIKRLPHRARALEILRLPDGIKSRTASPIEPKPQTTRASLMAALSGMNISQSLSLPLLGRIAAGTPIEALREADRFVDIPASLLTSKRGVAEASEHYALEVAGDSMIEAGIHDGDRVIIRRTDSADNGAIVVALIDDFEVTLKKLERRKDQIALIPANVNYETRLFDADRIKVQGRLVGLLRAY